MKRFIVSYYLYTNQVTLNEVVSMRDVGFFLAHAYTMPTIYSLRYLFRISFSLGAITHGWTLQCIPS